MIFAGVCGVVQFSLFVVAIVCLIIAIRSLKRRLYLRFFIYLLIAAVSFIYFDIIKERRTIVEHYTFEPTGPFNGIVRYFFRKYHYYPMSAKELMEKTSELEEDYERVFQKQRYYPWEWCLHLVKWPGYGIKTYLDDTINPKVDKALVTPFGIKTYLNDTILYCVSYSYGFDNDDDSLKVVYKYYELYDARKLNNILYMISPIPLNGDIFYHWEAVQSVNDYRLDTTFVHQLRELQGDTLTPEEYEESMRKREEFRRKEFRLE